MKIDFVIPVRDRDNERIQRCVNSLKSDITGKIIVVDYGSKVPVKVGGCEIIKEYNGNVWNKSHALNIGIKACTSNFIGSVDCDMVIGSEFLSRCKRYLKYDCFIFTRMVKRITPEFLDWELSRDKLMKVSVNWFVGKQTNLHQAVGGIQIYPRWWIHKVHGYDENLIYWGGIDNDIYERAFRTGLAIIDLNEIIFHQEHEKQKENNLDTPQEVLKAKDERSKRRFYLIYKWNQDISIGPEIWGEPNNPQQNEIRVQDNRPKVEPIEEEEDEEREE
jgi:glycosyltransferase involved in cell wall biosynthesis